MKKITSLALFFAVSMLFFSDLAYAGNLIIHGDSKPKIVYLTFDDGPNQESTLQILEILRKEQIKATFFVTGLAVSAYPELLKRIASEGHEIANHTWDHQRLSYLSLTGQRREIERCSSAIWHVTGTRPLLFRPPYGNFNQLTLKLGIPVVLWDIDPRDYSGIPADKIVEHIIDHAHGGAIILLHDRGKLNTVAALPEIIRRLKEQGYSFKTISRMS